MKKFLSNVFAGEPVEFTNNEEQGKDAASYTCSAKHLFWATVGTVVLMILATIL